MTIDVIIGPTAIRIGKYWMGCASGNRYTNIKRRTVKSALLDVREMEKSAKRSPNKRKAVMPAGTNRHSATRCPKQTARKNAR